MIVFLFFPIVSVVALDVGLEDLRPTGLGTNDPKTTIVLLIKIVLGFLAIVATTVIIIAGFKWMTAGGSEEKITSAKKLLTGAIVGLAIVLISYAVVYFVINALVGATKP